MKKNNLLVFTLIGTLTTFSSFSNASLPIATIPAILNAQNNQMVDNLAKSIVKEHEHRSERCSDPESEGSLASKQAEIINEKKELASKSTDLSKYFDIAQNNGCFAALANFPDLSASIPSITAILNALQKTLADYAVRKVCNAVNDAFESALGPVSEKIENLSKSGQLDLSGRVNKKLAKKLYEVDPELGRVQGSPAGKEVVFEW